MSLNSQLLNVVNDIEEINEQTAAINTSISTINENITNLGTNKQNNVQVTDTIQLSKLKAQYVTLSLTGKDLQTTLDGKQGKLIAGTNISIDADTNTISSSASGGTILDASTDITISNITCDDITANASSKIQAPTILLNFPTR